MNPADPRDRGLGENLPHGAHGLAVARHGHGHQHQHHHPGGAAVSKMLPRLVGGLRCLDVIREMEEQLVILTGARDRKGTPILTFPQNPRRERAKAEDYKRLLDYLLGVPW